MLKRVLALLVITVAPACAHTSQARESHDEFYTITGNEVLIWRKPVGSGCILATGPKAVLTRLQSSATTGRARFLIERLPAPSLEPLPPGIIVNDRTVRVRGVPVEPQCDSKDLYWIVDFQFIGPYGWNDKGQLVPESPSSR
jgi:hypothetical protein